MSAFSVRNAKGMEVVGGFAWRGDVYHSGHKVATVSNAGNGGCCNWYWHSRAAERDFARLALATFPQYASYEAVDTLADILWDAAMRAGN